MNIPLVEACQKMSNCSKFLKEKTSKKRNREEFETISLTKDCGSILKKELHKKLKDSRSFTIPCTIFYLKFKRALCNLSANISFLPLSIFNKIDLGEVKSINITLEMAEQCLSTPYDVVEDVLMKVEKFIILVDFVVLDIMVNKNVSVTFIRAFLAT